MNLAERRTAALIDQAVATFRLALVQAHQPGTETGLGLCVALLGEAWRLLLVADAPSGGDTSLESLVASRIDDDGLRHQLGALGALMARPDFIAVQAARPLVAPLIQPCVDAWLERAVAHGLDPLGPAGHALATVATGQDFDRDALEGVVGAEKADELTALDRDPRAHRTTDSRCRGLPHAARRRR